MTASVLLFHSYYDMVLLPRMTPACLPTPGDGARRLGGLGVPERRRGGPAVGWEQRGGGTPPPPRQDKPDMLGLGGRRAGGDTGQPSQRDDRPGGTADSRCCRHKDAGIDYTIAPRDEPPLGVPIHSGTPLLARGTNTNRILR